MNRVISGGEVRLAFRLIVKQPILSATIILALATGIYFATMGFTFRDELSTAPCRTRLATASRACMYSIAMATGSISTWSATTRRDRATTFEHVGAVGGRPFTVLHSATDVEAIRGTQITPRSMRWLDAAPVGRTLIPADGETGAEPVVLIRESLWRRRYSGDPNLSGRQITIGGQPRTVVGILPDTFGFPNSGELWLPLDEATLGGTAQPVQGRYGPGPGLRVFGVLRRVSISKPRTPRLISCRYSSRRRTSLVKWRDCWWGGD